MDADTLEAIQALRQTPHLTTRQAAFFLGLAPRTLEKMRVKGTGPRFRKHGRYVRYHIADLEAWSAERARTSTSQPAPSTRRQRGSLRPKVNSRPRNRRAVRHNGHPYTNV